MDHGAHGNHDSGGMPMPSSQCSMNMLWNSQIAGTCIVFPQWHIRSALGMALSCLVIIGISIAYARLLHFIRLRDRRTAASASAGGGYEYASLPYAGGGEGNAFPPQFGRLSLPNLGGSREHSPVSASPPPMMAQHRFPPSVPVRWGMKARLVRAGLYAVTVAISFFLMLVAMTYNTYLFGAIIVGSFIGHLMYESEIDTGASGVQKGLACH